MWQFHDPPMLLLVFRNLRLVEDLNQTEHGADLALKWQFTGLSDEDSTVQIQNFLEISDTSTGGQALEKTYAELYTLLNRISQGTQNLEKQFRKLASAQNSKPQGGLPVNTDPNPKKVNLVSTRSGIKLKELSLKKNVIKVVSREGEPHNKEEVAPAEKVQPIVRPSPPLPQKFKKKKEDECFGIPGYAKYVKEIVANKRRLTEYETITLTKECSSRIQNRLHMKLKDPGILTVQITIGQSIHVRVLNSEPNPEVPFILGRPFLATGKAIIDVTDGQLTMRAHDKVEVFDVYRALKMPPLYEELSTITVVDLEVDCKHILAKDSLERVMRGDEIYADIDAHEIVRMLDLVVIEELDRRWEPLNRVLRPPPKPSVEEAPKLELKELPAHLRYAFLGVNDTLPVILSATLSDEQVEAALLILKKRKAAIGWQMSDIQGISRALCMHKIYMKEGYKASAQQQRRLNHLMKDVVRKEVIKWLDAGIMYPVSESKWVRNIIAFLIDTPGIVLGHNVSKNGLEVDKAKIEVIEKLPPPVSVKGVRSFLGHAGFYRRFIKDFCKIAKPMCNLLEKEVKFKFDKNYLESFEVLKQKMIEAPILVASN
ncbi:uncharacterized protein [Solanum lycopersicum]|uniref:uncharacterized protein n=1 Tax=Solanum lycopersicum TaxID=4081 RepID=UPI00374903A1